MMRIQRESCYDGGVGAQGGQPSQSWGVVAKEGFMDEVLSKLRPEG